MVGEARFDGFPRELPKFLSTLGRNHDREWFQAHRADYEACYLEPALAFDPEQLERFRKAGPYELGEPALKRVPRGFDPDHPNAEFLRHKGFGAMAELDLPDALFTAKAVPYVIERFRELRPIQQWLVKAFA
jgi:uncharacterized protein (DUF2461 family)